MKRYTMRMIALLLALVMGLTLLSGCSGKNNGNENDKQNTPSDTQQTTATTQQDDKQTDGEKTDSAKPARDSLTFVTWIKHTTYDVTAGGTADKGINHAIFDTLLKFGPDGTYEPMLAESWEEADGGMSVILHLRDDVTFHDGSTFDADDVIYFFDKGMEGKFATRITPYVASYEKLDQYTVKLTKPNIYTNVLAFLVEHAYIIPKEAHSADPEGFNQHPIGTGPYTFVSEEADGSIILKAYDNYYGEAPGVANIRVQPPLDASAAVIALETGDADFIVNVPNSQHSIIAGNDKLTLVTSPNWSSQMVLLMGKKLNADINLRKAIFYGINRENALILAAEGQGSVTKELFSDRMMGEFKGKVPMEGYDLEKAKAALAESDYDSEPIYITITGNAALAQSIQSDLKQVGIDVKIEQVDTAALLQKLNTGEMDMYQTDMGNSTMTPQSLLNTFSEMGKQIGENMFTTPEYNALVSEIKAMSDNSQLEAKTQEGLEMLRDMYTFVNLYQADANFAYSSDFVYDYPVSATTFIYYYAQIKPAA